MHHLQQMLLSAVCVLVVYLLYQQQQLLLLVSDIQLQQTKAAEVTQKALTPLLEQITTIKAVTDRLGKEADNKTAQQLSSLQNKLALHQVLLDVAAAERLRAEGKGSEAADKLLSLKSPVWQASLALPNFTSRLQALMVPIDQLSTAWKNKDTSSPPDTIRQEVEKILGELKNG